MRLSSEGFAVGLRMLLDIESDQTSEPIHFIGRVVWIGRAGNQGRYRLGIEFLGMSELARERLRQLVADRSPAGDD
jgi:hypothetical protein